MPENCLTMASWADTSPFCARTISSRSKSIFQYAIVRIGVTAFCSPGCDYWYHRIGGNSLDNVSTRDYSATQTGLRTAGPTVAAVQWRPLSNLLLLIGAGGFQ